MSEPILKADSLSLTIDGKTILSDVSLLVARGERILIRGVSGAGKTTLFNVLGLLEPPTDGTLTVAGTDTAALSERERARVRRDTVGIIFQDFKLISDLTAWENAILPQDHANARDEAWLDELFERLNIAALADSSPQTLSGGERQRVAIARALANRPEVILADEPTGQLDPGTAQQVTDLLFELHQETGTALVLVSHDPRFEADVERAVRIVDGTIARDSNQSTKNTRNSLTSSHE